MSLDILLDKVVNFGNPFHGYWVNGVFTLPNAAVKTLTQQPKGGAADFPEYGLAAAGNVYSGYWPSHGDCQLVEIAGLPAPENTTADTAAGRTWLNYALISGASHLYCGKELGNNGFIYIDPANKPWHLRISKPNTNFVIDFKKIGDFFGTNVIGSITVAEAGSGVSGVKTVLVSDANSKGRTVCIDTFSNASYGINLSSRKPVRVVLTGTPNTNLAATFSPLPAEETTGSGPLLTHYQNPGVIAPIQVAPGDACITAINNAVTGHKAAPTTTSTIYAAPGLLFDGDTENVVRSSTEWNFGTSISFPSQLWQGDVVYASSGLWRLKIGSISTTEPFTIVQTRTATTSTITWTFRGMQFTGDQLLTAPLLYLIRRSSKVWEWVIAAVSGTMSPLGEIGGTTGSLYSLALVMPDRIERTNSLIPVSSLKSGRHFSYHPKTKELLAEVIPVCWL